MVTSMPNHSLSFLIAAHHSKHSLPALVENILKQAGTLYTVELVISADDDFDYPSILPTDPRIVYAEKGLNSRPGPARTRAYNACSSTHFCLMDADDDISGNFVETVFDDLKSHQAFALRSVYVRGGNEVKRYRHNSMTFSDLIFFYGSIHTVAPVGFIEGYLDVVAEDVLATMAVLSQVAGVNGPLYVSEAEYHINLHDESYCAQNGAKFIDMYKDALSNAQAIANDLRDPTLGIAVERLYQTRLDMSNCYDHHLSGTGQMDYHDFASMMSHAFQERSVINP